MLHRPNRDTATRAIILDTARALQPNERLDLGRDLFDACFDRLPELRQMIGAGYSVTDGTTVRIERL